MTIPSLGRPGVQTACIFPPFSMAGGRGPLLRAAVAACVLLAAACFMSGCGGERAEPEPLPDQERTAPVPRQEPIQEPEPSPTVEEDASVAEDPDPETPASIDARLWLAQGAPEDAVLHLTVPTARAAFEWPFALAEAGAGVEMAALIAAALGPGESVAEALAAHGVAPDAPVALYAGPPDRSGDGEDPGALPTALALRAADVEAFKTAYRRGEPAPWGAPLNPPEGQRLDAEDLHLEALDGWLVVGADPAWTGRVAQELEVALDGRDIAVANPPGATGEWHGAADVEALLAQAALPLPVHGLALGALPDFGGAGHLSMRWDEGEVSVAVEPWLAAYEGAPDPADDPGEQLFPGLAAPAHWVYWDGALRPALAEAFWERLAEDHIADPVTRGLTRRLMADVSGRIAFYVWPGGVLEAGKPAVAVVVETPEPEELLAQLRWLLPPLDARPPGSGGEDEAAFGKPLPFYVRTSERHLILATDRVLAEVAQDRLDADYLAGARPGFSFDPGAVARLLDAMAPAALDDGGPMMWDWLHGLGAAFAHVDCAPSGGLGGYAWRLRAGDAGAANGTL